MEPLVVFMAAVAAQIIIVLNLLEVLVVMEQFVSYGLDQPVHSHQPALAILN
jgi:hypothetical protein